MITENDFNQIDSEVRAWESNYIAQTYVDVITYPCPKRDVGLVFLS